MSITCTSDFGVSAVEWLRDRQVVSSADGNEGVLSTTTLNENDYGSQYTCRTTASFGTQERTITIQMEGMYRHHYTNLTFVRDICDVRARDHGKPFNPS